MSKKTQLGLEVITYEEMKNSVSAFAAKFDNFV